MKASENATVTGIIKRVRKECSSYPLPTAAAEMLKLVREIEVAHRREVAELRECLNESVFVMQTLFDKQMPKWRKALEGESGGTE